MADERQRLFDLRHRVFGIDAAQRHLLHGAAARGAEVQPPAGDDVEHRGALGDAHRVVVAERHAHGRVTDADARVFAATADRKISGALMCEYSTSEWCSTAHTASKPTSSAYTAWSMQLRIC